MKFTFLTGNDNIRRQRAALTRDILVLKLHFTTFKAEQWSYFPQTRVYHADMFEKAMQNLARVCILAFSPVYAHCARRISSDKPKCLFHFLSCRFRHHAFYLGARLNKMQVLDRIPHLEMSFNNSDKNVYLVASRNMKDVYSSMGRIRDLTTLQMEDVHRMRNKTLIHPHRVLTVANQVLRLQATCTFETESYTVTHTFYAERWKIRGLYTLDTSQFFQNCADSFWACCKRVHIDG
jgi:hypothetical protein